MRGKNPAMLFSLSLLASALPATAIAADGDWEWYVAPYIWLPTITADLDTRGPGGGGGGSGVEVFPDVLDEVDGAFLGHLEGQGDRFGMFADITYMSLGGGSEFAVAETDSSLDATIFEVAGVWSPGDGNYRGFELFAGLRYIDLSFDIEIDPTNPALASRSVDAGESFSDLMVGARYTGRWGENDKFGFTLRGDGSWGVTEGTWNASGTFSWQAGPGAWLLGYRYLTGELEPNRNVVELEVYGPIFGYGFSF